MSLVKKITLFFRELFFPDKQSPQSAVVFALMVLLIVIPVRLFVAKPFIVSGMSMYPTFDSWHYLIVDQLTYKLEEPKRGDVIVFKYPRDPSRFFIKRIIALPNETIVIDGTTTIIKNSENPNGFELDEKYVSPAYEKVSHMTVSLGSSEYFVMGDNRSASADSRYWGPLDESKIVGRAIARLFPFAAAETFPGGIQHNIND